MASVYERLRALGIELPQLPPPAGNYVHAVRTGNLLFLAGKGIGAHRGKVGGDVSVEQAYAFARSTGIALLAVIHHELGSLDRVTRIVKVLGFVNAVPEFATIPRSLTAVPIFSSKSSASVGVMRERRSVQARLPTRYRWRLKSWSSFRLLYERSRDD